MPPVIVGDGSGGTTRTTGVRLTATAPAGYSPVIERSPSGAGTWTEIAQLPVSTGAAQVYLDVLPLDGVVRDYRSRARGTGVSDGSVSATKSSAPKVYFV